MKQQSVNTTRQIVITALLAALTCVATMLIQIPSPLGGYLNLGDSVVLLCGWCLSPVYGFLAAGIGSALADLLGGYLVYVPATLMIKGLMSVIAHYGFRLLHKRMQATPAMVLSGIAAEVVMVLGYYINKGILYDFVAALSNIPGNAVQGAAGLILGIALCKIFQKAKLFMNE
ncbi:MAG: ECF transporter S component [Ruminococcaceae bacterium]|nr:ECF transporter S component [Oscillospiraceae bacterium]